MSVYLPAHDLQYHRIFRDTASLTTININMSGRMNWIGINPFKFRPACSILIQNSTLLFQVNWFLDYPCKTRQKNHQKRFLCHHELDSIKFKQKIEAKMCRIFCALCIRLDRSTFHTITTIIYSRFQHTEW